MNYSLLVESNGLDSIIAMPTRILIVTDLHQRAVLYEALIRLAGGIKPDAIILGGDFLHHLGLQQYGKTRQLTPGQCAEELQAIGAPMFFVRGNHEDENWFEFRDAWNSLKAAAPVRLNGGIAKIGEIGVVGFPCLMGHEQPFSEGERFGGKHYQCWFRHLFAAHGDDATRLWIMHEPPTGTQISEAGSAVEGNAWWRDAIEEQQPEVVVCGHDHTTPISRGVWLDQIGRTNVINVGQNMDGPLHATLIERSESGRLKFEKLVMV